MKKLPSALIGALAMNLVIVALAVAHTATPICAESGGVLVLAKGSSTADIIRTDTDPDQLKYDNVPGNGSYTVPAGTYTVIWSDGFKVKHKVVDQCQTPTPSPSVTPSPTPPPTPSPSPSPTPSSTPTPTPSASVPPETSPTPSSQPSGSPSPVPTGPPTDTSDDVDGLVSGLWLFNLDPGQAFALVVLIAVFAVAFIGTLVRFFSRGR